MNSLSNTLKPLITVLLISLSSQATAQWFSHSFETMGTQAKVEFEHEDPIKGEALVKAVVAEMERVNQAMSPYIETSELSVMNREAKLKPFKISEELFQLLKRSNDVSKLTGGAFDVTFSSLAYLYDYRAGKKPSEAEIKQLKSAINYKKVILNESDKTVFYKDSRIKIDLGGIGKGHAVDKCIEILQRAGIKNGFVNAGGDSRIIGKKADRLWYIGIRHPRDDKKLIANLPLEDIALSTSGDYERFFEQDGVRYHHIIDPKTGDSARVIQSATILADDSTTADALSTSIFILGVEKGMALVNRTPNVSAIMVNSQGKMFLSKDLMPAND